MDNSAPSLGFLSVSFIECDIQTRFEPIHVVSSTLLPTELSQRVPTLLATPVNWRKQETGSLQ